MSHCAYLTPRVQSELEAIKKAGFKVITSYDKALEDEIPWYDPLAANYTIQGWRHTPMGRTFTHYMVWTLEKCFVAPKGSTKVPLRVHLNAPRPARSVPASMHLSLLACADVRCMLLTIVRRLTSSSSPPPSRWWRLAVSAFSLPLTSISLRSPLRKAWHFEVTTHASFLRTVRASCKPAAWRSPLLRLLTHADPAPSGIESN